jgi:hypothetical protein
MWLVSDMGRIVRLLKKRRWRQDDQNPRCRRSLRAIAARTKIANTMPNAKPARCAHQATAPNAGPM